MTQIVSTIEQRCKRCYSCIRECPAAAIRVMDGQAVVISERCIACGHCVKVCSQHAKKVSSDIEKVLDEFIPFHKVAAIVAPSFPASFPKTCLKLPAGLRKLGFSSVTETAFGADLISPVYDNLFKTMDEKTIISSPCPAIYTYIEKYFPELVPKIAPVVSPMIAMGRYLKESLGKDIKVVFIGPCVAKKNEYMEKEVEDAVDAVLTFTELKEIFNQKNLDLSELENGDFDPPFAATGKSFPLSGGLLKTANIPRDILTKKVIVADGKERVKEIIHDIYDNKINAKFVDILFCEGCISGPGIDSDLNFYSKREEVINYIDEKIQCVDKTVWKSELYNSRNLNLSRTFTNKNQRRPMPSEEKIREILANTGKVTKSDELNCGACGYSTCKEYAIGIAKGLAEEDMCLPYLIEKLEKAYIDLKDTQEQLHDAEKLASIGQLAAGVAHEINNPLGTIMIYSSMVKKNIEKTLGDGQNIEDLKLILAEAQRCKNIVANLLNFARQGKLKIAEVDLLSILIEITKSIKNNPDYQNISIELNDLKGNNVIHGDPDQLKQVFVNLITNACEAMEDSEKKEIKLKTYSEGNDVCIEIADTGCGIPEDNLNKLFTPFFTTKKMGKGTGLGLAISYGIIKMHKGNIKVESSSHEGTRVKISLPNNLKSY